MDRTGNSMGEGQGNEIKWGENGEDDDGEGKGTSVLSYFIFFLY